MTKGKTTEEQRMERLMESFENKQDVRDALSTWFLHFVLSKEFGKMSRIERAKSVNCFAELTEFFA